MEEIIDEFKLVLNNKPEKYLRPINKKNYIEIYLTPIARLVLIKHFYFFNFSPNLIRDKLTFQLLDQEILANVNINFWNLENQISRTVVGERQIKSETTSAENNQNQIGQSSPYEVFNIATNKSLVKIQINQCHPMELVEIKMITVLCFIKDPEDEISNNIEVFVPTNLNHVNSAIIRVNRFIFYRHHQLVDYSFKCNGYYQGSIHDQDYDTINYVTLDHQPLLFDMISNKPNQQYIYLLPSEYDYQIHHYVGQSYYQVNSLGSISRLDVINPNQNVILVDKLELTQGLLQLLIFQMNINNIYQFDRDQYCSKFNLAVINHNIVGFTVNHLLDQTSTEIFDDKFMVSNFKCLKDISSRYCDGCSQNINLIHYERQLAGGVRNYDDDTDLCLQCFEQYTQPIQQLLQCRFNFQKINWNNNQLIDAQFRLPEQVKTKFIPTSDNNQNSIETNDQNVVLNLNKYDQSNSLIFQPIIVTNQIGSSNQFTCLPINQVKFAELIEMVINQQNPFGFWTVNCTTRKLMNLFMPFNANTIYDIYNCTKYVVAILVIYCVRAVDRVTESVRLAFNWLSQQKTGCLFCQEILVADTLVKCPDCQIVVHKSCIETWLTKGSLVCPHCRSSVWIDYLDK